MQVLLMHYGCWQFIIQTKPEQPDEEATYKEKLDLQLRKDVGIFISRVKTAATRLQEAGHKLDDLYIGFQLIRWVPQEFQSTVQQIYKWKEEDLRVVKIEAELILEANRLQLMKQDLEKAENAYLSSFTSKKSKTLPGATAAAHGDPNGKNDYQKKGGKVFTCKTIKNVKQSIKTIGPCYVCNKYGHLRVNCKEKKSLQKSPSTVNETFNIEFNINLRFYEAECSLLELDKQLVASCILFEENSDKGVWVIDTAATSHFCNDTSLFLDLKLITNMKMSLATEDKSCPVEGIGTLRFRQSPREFHSKKTGAVRSKRQLELLHMDLCGPMPTESQGGNKYFLSIIDDYSRKVTVFPIRNKSDVFHTFIRFQKRAERFLSKRQKVNSNLGYNLNLPDYYDDEDDFDRVKDSLTNRLVSKTSTETPSTSEKPDVSSDNHSLIPCTEVKWIRNIGRKVTGSNVYYSIEGEATRLKSFNEIERYCKRHNIEYDPSLFNFRKDNTESQGFSDLSEQQEALMVEVTIPNCYKQAIRSRDASKWHDAMDKEINVMMERKVWDLFDHPDNIKILENRWVYTIKYDENNKIVRYKARLVAQGNTQLRGESFDEVFSPVINFTIVRLFFTICVCLWKCVWTHIQVDITNAYLYANLDTVIYMKQPTGYEIDNNKVYSDFATNRDDRVSMGGFITFIDETPISWRTFKQKSVSLSTMEAEYVSLTEAAKEFIWLKNRGRGSLVVKVMHSWSECQEFEPNIAQDPPCKGAMHVKSVESANDLLLEWCGS
ncbi:retrovirus-related Pol polyprotein from transposon RE1 [Trichonephila clavipes]|nr:retrovirus-related Pol polyprotein from transposon RE1 [Trichonephila clavipes]